MEQLAERDPLNGGQPYIKRVPTDPWAEAYLYERISDPPPEFDLLSKGRDTVEYTEDDVSLAHASR